MEQENEYLVDGAVLTCSLATKKTLMIQGETYESGVKHTNSILERPEAVSKLKVKPKKEGFNGYIPANIYDSKKITNIVPFGNCLSILTSGDVSIIKQMGEQAKCFGICQCLMNLNEEWENLPAVNGFFEFPGEEGENEAYGITRTSILFCKRGGLISALTSGQSKRSDTGRFVGYLAYGCKSITQNPDEGYFMLYDGPTVDGAGEEYTFLEIYRLADKERKNALQGFGGNAGLNTIEGTIRYEDQDNYNSRNGVLSHNGIERHTVAIGPALQNPNFTLNENGGLKGTEMIYGTCIDITIEFEGKEYFIPAVVVDCKAHSADKGYVQTGQAFNGENAGGEQGNIIEWYVTQGKDSKNKSAGLKQFTENGGIIIYRDEIMLEKTDE